MKRPANGGPVHPIILPSESASCDDQGIRLRQWYAGTILAGLVSHPNTNLGEKNNIPRRVAYAFEHADAMIAYEMEGK